MNEAIRAPSSHPSIPSEHSTPGLLALEMLHEIRNPLEALSSLLYLGIEKAEEPREVMKYLMLAREQASSINQIVNSTLGYAKSRRAPAPTSLVSLVGAAIRVNQRHLTAKRIVLITDLPSVLVVFVHSGEILQVVSNLIENAADAVQSGGTIRIHLRGREVCAHIVVADNGCGITEAGLREVFTPYFTTKGDGGNGLGLSISKDIVERHGGSIRVRSSVQPGRSGTAFRVSLPTAAN